MAVDGWNLCDTELFQKEIHLSQSNATLWNFCHQQAILCQKMSQKSSGFEETPMVCWQKQVAPLDSCFCSAFLRIFIQATNKGPKKMASHGVGICQELLEELFGLVPQFWGPVFLWNDSCLGRIRWAVGCCMPWFWDPSPIVDFTYSYCTAALVQAPLWYGTGPQ